MCLVVGLCIYIGMVLLCVCACVCVCVCVCVCCVCCVVIWETEHAQAVCISLLHSVFIKKLRSSGTDKTVCWVRQKSTHTHTQHIHIHHTHHTHAHTHVVAHTNDMSRSSY